MAPLLIVAVVSVFCAISLYVVATRRGEDRMAYALIGLFLGPLGLLLLLTSSVRFRRRWLKFVLRDKKKDAWPPEIRRLR